MTSVSGHGSTTAFLSILLDLADQRKKNLRWPAEPGMQKETVSKETVSFIYKY